MGERTLRNLRTGETITFLKTTRDTGGALFQMSYRMAPHGAIADEHAHPNQEMIIEVREGTLTCMFDGADRRIGAGETVTIPAGAMHFQRNDTDEEVYAVESYRPALQMREFFEVLIGWANDGKTNEFGLPSRLRLAVLHRYFHRTIISSSRRRTIEARLLARIGVLRGYRREIERYIAAARA